ncbi:pyruvate dehydrogenase (acetyl-transferring) E1 component subunit alpha [Roseateles oligotrophus]|uniref:Pyruvate dehydrogenase E1 component subunit alpha n=1 Tax=Roseateles oligotrophus TaxID=1769250 RepID=A0ABT2YIN1_9BURK|nr:pyruvate dehydrogenase (acetyl-transferring) E1 component subunit alpha [Roseateles oligotrophus]MCV2369924.1 pyruvate dehydrogenase (acetyl-transferring) E1 component subunit alpha [Roseateles oligotrophus]
MSGTAATPESADLASIEPRRHERAFCLARLADMVRIRRMEERCAQLYGEGKIRGFLHLYIGEEAVAAGIFCELKPEDKVLATYREHGHALLRGVSMKAIMAEMFGKQEGCSRGRGGSMHLFDKACNFYGGNAIVGAGLPSAVGLALADQMLGRKGCVTVCFFGEGAVAEGVFHESLNLAALWQLPVLFVCENNLYAMGTALARSEAQISLTAKAAAQGLPTGHINGMNVLAVHAAAAQAIAFVRREQRPFFLELHTYRFRAHSMFDAELYRDKQEVERWKTHDPIACFAAQLRAAEMLNDVELQQIEQAAEQELEAAVRFAEAGSWEPVEQMFVDVVAGPAGPKS